MTYLFRTRSDPAVRFNAAIPAMSSENNLDEAVWSVTQE